MWTFDQEGDADGDGTSEPHYFETEQTEFLETKYEVQDGSYIWTDTGFTADHDFKYTQTQGTTTTRIHLSGEYVDLFGTPVDRSKLEEYLNEPDWQLPIALPADPNAKYQYPNDTAPPTVTEVDVESFDQTAIPDVLDGTASLRSGTITETYTEVGQWQLQHGKLPTSHADYSYSRDGNTQSAGLATTNYSRNVVGDEADGASIDHIKTDSEQQATETGTVTNADNAQNSEPLTFSFTFGDTIYLLSGDIVAYDQQTSIGREIGVQAWVHLTTIHTHEGENSTFSEQGQLLDGEFSQTTNNYFLLVDVNLEI